MYSKIIRGLKKTHPEILIWISGFAVIFFLFNEASEFTICPFHNIGLSFCPGCGLGKSIGYLFIFDFHNSFAAHPLGIPALLIITHRIFTLLKQSNNLSERKSNG